MSVSYRFGRGVAFAAVTWLVVLAALTAGGAQAATGIGDAWWAIASEQTPTILRPGDEGKIIVSATDVGDVGVNATNRPVTITDQLPSDVKATEAKWSIGFGSPVWHEQWPIAVLEQYGFGSSCTTTSEVVSCTLAPLSFLPVAALEPNLRIEVEISVDVAADAGQGPAEFNEATISGGEPLACREVGPEEGGFVDADCHGESPFGAPFPASRPNHLDFEQEATGRSVVPASVRRTLLVGDEAVDAGIDQYEFSASSKGGASEGRAGSHPDQLTTFFVLNQSLERKRGPNEGKENAGTLPELPRNLRFDLPPGLIGNPTSVPRCSTAQFLSKPSSGTVADECPADTAVGVAMVTIDEPATLHLLTLPVPVFNLEPTTGEPARFGMFVGGVLPIFLDTAVQGSNQYRVSVTASRIPEVSTLLSSRVTFWGNPADPSHRAQRGWSCIAGGFYGFLVVGTGNELPSCGESQAPATGRAAPFLRLPTSCASDLEAPLFMQTWAVGAGYLPAVEPEQNIRTEGCNRLPFDPTLAVDTDARTPESATGIVVHLKVPQEASEAPEGLAESDVRNTKVALPPGLKINPAAAAGLQACSERQIGFSHMRGDEAVFDESPASCPEASKLGKVKISTPLLEEPVTGWVYQAAQGANPFHSLLALYVVAEAPKSGILVKLVGKVETDEHTGQVVSTFAETPQLPFSEFELTIFGGSSAPLATSTCGAYKTETQIEPWSGGAAATPSSEFQVSGCANPQRFQPAFSAGTESPLAGLYSPFVLNLRREDGEGQISRIDTVLPKGLTGKLAGIPYCPESAIRQAEARSNPGEGAMEQAAPSCPAASQVGTVRVGAGVGPRPYFVNGSVYLAGPYKGAPLSLVIVTPAVAGPFDLGNVVVRTALYLNEETAQITARSDALPTMLQGIPLDVRSISLRMDRSHFTLNPTNCEAMTLGGTATSTTGRSAVLANRFQVGGCKGLDFAPRLKLRLKGATGRTGHPALKAVVTARPGEANIGRAQVNLPHGEFLDQANIDKACTRPVLLAGNCPKSSVYGYARAWTPLLAKPLQGPVYLVGGYGYKLPALVAELNGQIRILLVGKVDSGRNKGIRNTFEVVPDAPVSRFVLRMKGGRKYGLLENSEDLCKAKKSKRRAIVRFTGQNGKVEHFKPVVANQCGRHKKHKKRDTSHARAVSHVAAEHRRQGRVR